jgi:hypothetical protein
MFFKTYVQLTSKKERQRKKQGISVNVYAYEMSKNSTEQPTFYGFISVGDREGKGRRTEFRKSLLWVWGEKQLREIEPYRRDVLIE